MQLPRLRATAAVIAASVLTAACVTITPLARVGDVATPPPATAGQQTLPPAADTTPPPSSTAPTAAPDPTHKPPKTPRPEATPPATPTATPIQPVATANPDDPACSDDAFQLEGFAWDSVYHWRYNSASTPSAYDPQAVLAVVMKAFDNITGEYNDCGRADNILAYAQYQGNNDTQTPCTDQPDGTNSIAWGKMPADLSPNAIAYTCPYYAGADGNIGYEADIVINKDVAWSLSAQTCFFQELLEPTLTHEVGHVFGLDHVNERQHGDLTMSTTSNGWCDDSASTLGLGDMLGLEQLYPGK